jgi:flagellar basal-body rod modification protein FlgD
MTTVNNVSSDMLATMSGGGGSKGVAESEQNKFMTLLVTQMKNQDPLNPLDNAQMTSQLAQLSTLSGIEKLNGTLESFITGYQSGQALHAANMIGRAVLVPGEHTNLVEGQAVFGAELAEPADKVTVNIRDADGNLVHSVDLGEQKEGVIPLAWDGKTADGETAPDGRYKIEVVATRGDEIMQGKALTFGEVLSVSVGPQGIRLNLLGAGEASMNDVRQIL